MSLVNTLKENVSLGLGLVLLLFFFIWLVIGSFSESWWAITVGVLGMVGGGGLTWYGWKKYKQVPVQPAVAAVPAQ